MFVIFKLEVGRVFKIVFASKTSAGASYQKKSIKQAPFMLLTLSPSPSRYS